MNYSDFYAQNSFFFLIHFSTYCAIVLVLQFYIVELKLMRQVQRVTVFENSSKIL